MTQFTTFSKRTDIEIWIEGVVRYQKQFCWAFDRHGENPSYVLDPEETYRANCCAATMKESEVVVAGWGSENLQRDGADEKHMLDALRQFAFSQFGQNNYFIVIAKPKPCYSDAVLEFMCPVDEPASSSNHWPTQTPVTNGMVLWADEDVNEVSLASVEKSSERTCVECRKKRKPLIKCQKCNAWNCRSCGFWCTTCPKNFKQKYILCSNCYGKSDDLVQVASRVWTCQKCSSSGSKRW